MSRSQERTYFAARLVPRTPTPFCSGFLVQPPFLEFPATISKNTTPIGNGTFDWKI